VQETWLAVGRFGDAARDECATRGAYLVRILTRRRSTGCGVSRRREDYVGQWLPEPLLTSPDVAEDVEWRRAVSIAMLTVLETLGRPNVRCSCCARCFDVSYEEIAEAVGKSAATRPADRRTGPADTWPRGTRGSR